MEILFKHVNIFLSLFGLTLDCDTKEKQGLKIAIVDYEGVRVGDILFDYETDSYSINIESISFPNLKARIYLNDFVEDDKISKKSVCSFDYNCTFSNESDRLDGSFKTSFNSNGELDIRSELRYNYFDGEKRIIKLKNNIFGKIFSLDDNKHFIEVLNSVPDTKNFFHYVKLGELPNDLIAKSQNSGENGVSNINVYYKSNNLATTFNKAPTKAGDELLGEYCKIFDEKRVVDDGRGNLFDTCNIISELNPDFVLGINQSRERMTFSGICLFDNLASLVYSGLTEQEFEAMLGYDFRKLIDTPIIGENNELILPQFKFSKKKHKGT